ncbi:2-oxoglutarate dehydrogenase complex dihydrolipoyllysine-residue succinyltransferase [Candidatus Pelagibacter sp. RS40]|jgi:2-oxoglutarate dehydrogenase E2 component (dihydrolipoamide succinyltransferase)|uniref:2-oxoglutarate dehydrogenase complex dihydrolipoyllysine-residue succinyltransferase n=1 Tax=Candidatus Pelagibacter sp. RS40 TaxID=1977865 RepID=UPI000A14E9FE|nr:2-oxoglutarate dehydrogenase complex dihydrolipoyllysine-residue succinyltransferase [Candidatus Pelagibacter sp. RS40]ARJ48954.1 dihydrolipoamide succinyltransferase [Candidatus Pelagibacter sp. RS40]|tara:strand:- start:153 stop:1487 length:1335 start_codon:yes stop_codon:yes gene_type:complete
MSEKILVPVLGESITEATVSKWLKKQGDSVIADEAVVELETDKVNLEVPASTHGVIAEINANEGDTVEVGAVLGVISETANKTENKPSNQVIEDQKDQVEENPKIFETKVEPTLETEEKDNVISLDVEKKQKVLETSDEEQPFVLTDEVLEPNAEETKINPILSPAVRKMVAEKKIDLEQVKPTGKDGRILKGDLISMMGANPQPNQRKIQFGEEERIKMSRLRQTIAKRLKEAQENAAMLTTFNEVDMSGIMSMRKENQEDFQARYGIKLGFMSFFVKACVVGLKLFPAINAEIEGQEIIYKNYYNISFAVGTEKGLVVPVLKNADEMSFADIEKEIKNLSEKAKNNSLVIEDLQGGTFTISNGGVYGSMLSTPILNPPQSGVLGMHNIVERPVVQDNEIKVKPIMYLALSYDHRIIDGKDSVSFLKTVKENLEDPRRLFLNI